MRNLKGPLKQLNQRSFLRAVTLLGERDPDLGMIVTTYGPPPFWVREEGFHTLMHFILEQQVSLASAKAAYDRLVAVTRQLTPENFLRLDDAELKTIGFSRQKVQYGRHLAEAIGRGDLDLSALATLDDTEAKAQLTQIKGIGAWTAEVYLLMALRRPDIWPAGDLGVVVAVQELKRLPRRPSTRELMELSYVWQPWRAVATRILWHSYLSRRRRITSPA
jgi:DNA-3-methyladenine glycosylase II